MIIPVFEQPILNPVCDGKVQFRNRKLATKALCRMRDQTGDTRLYSYCCNKCGQYHLGHIADITLQQPLKGALRSPKRKPLGGRIVVHAKPKTKKKKTRVR